MITPHYYQANAKQAIFDYFENGGIGNPLVCMPTASGKSIVIADFLREVFRQFPNQRVMMLTHVWKLISQNAEKMRIFWPNAPIGIHSSGLKERDVTMPIIFGGVQSVAPTLAKNPLAFGWRDLILIDEAHLLGSDEDSQYLKVIAALTKINPHLKVIGFTATPYRLKMGLLTDGGLFSDIAFDMTTHEWFQRLIGEGFLSPLIGKPTNTQIEGIGNLSVVGGDFNAKQSEELIDTENITYSACQEILEYGANRNKCMVFAAGVNNSEHIADCLTSMGASAAAVHSKLKSDEVKARLSAFERGEIWALVGANMFTTGYDEPRIDLIADLQPTCSPGKHVQKLGRGTRVHPSKSNTLILDFAGNIARNGPIDDPVMPRKPGVKSGEPPPIKFCETIKLEVNQKRFEEMNSLGKIDLNDPELTQGCGAYNHASARFCCNCGAAFSFSTKLFATARNDAPMKQEETPIIELVKIKPPVFYAKNNGKDKGGGFISPPTVRVTYTIGLRPINVFLCFEHTGKARRLAHEWWQRHASTEAPATVEEFLSRTHELRIPKEVRIHVNKQYPTIESYEF